MKTLLGTFVSLLASSAMAWAQAPSPTPMAPVAPGGSAPSGGIAALTVVIIAAVLLVVIGVAVKLFDLKRNREADAVQLQSQVSDALLRDQVMFGLPVTPTAHVPFWSGTPATLEVSGQVPTPELRDAVLRVALQEAVRARPDVVIEDRVVVAPRMARAA